MQGISAVIITYNEEKYLEKCLRSVQKVADEILVVDSFSTDNTLSICEKYGVRVLKHEFEGYIEQKNWAFSQAENDYIISLDGDEMLSEELIGNILAIKGNLKHDGYYLNRRNYYYGEWVKHSGAYPDRKLRLIDRRKGSWKGINPHDQFVLNKGSRTKRLRGDLIHYYYDSLEEHLSKVLKFSTIHAESLYKLGKKGSIFSIIVNPQWRFIRDYFINQGFRDGFKGYLICYLNAKYCLLKYLKLRHLRRGGDDPVVPGFNFIKL